MKQQQWSVSFSVICVINKHAQPLILSLLHASLSRSLPLPHFHTYSQSKVQPQACAHTHTQKMLTPPVYRRTVVVKPAKPPLRHLPLTPSSLEAASFPSPSLSAPPTTPLPPSFQPLQHHDGTNIPHRDLSYNKLTFTLKSHQLPISRSTSLSSSVSALHLFSFLFVFLSVLFYKTPYKLYSEFTLVAIVMCLYYYYKICLLLSVEMSVLADRSSIL